MNGKRGCFPRRARHALAGCAFSLLLAGWISSGHTHPHDLKNVVELTTVWRLSVPVITIEPSLPVGTVIAATVIPEGSDWYTSDGWVDGGIWSRHGLNHRNGISRTDLNGVQVRVVAEKNEPARGRSGFFPHTWRQGGWRIELVKSGLIRGGLLTRVRDPLEYRLYAGQNAHHLLARESLQLESAVSIRVSAPHTQQPGGKSRDA